MPPSRRGTGFVGLGQYLGLNQGSATSMGNALAQPVEEQGAGWQSGLRTTQDAFRNDVDSHTLQAPQPSVDKDTATRLATTTYGGPTQLPGAGDMMHAAGKIQTQANALGTMAGRQALLKDKYGNNTWGGGALDSALAGAGGAGGRLEAARGAYGKLAQQLGTAQTEASAYADKGAKTTAENARQYGEIASRPVPAAPVATYTPLTPAQLRRAEEQREQIELHRNPRG